ncbi:MAG: NHL repeat-containing protein, partial [Candidatus Krumholzibacteria bacterium]|nr:NHL repeat-containing protein [Candidatus Krumholzibacteria bacterium]
VARLAFRSVCLWVCGLIWSAGCGTEAAHQTLRDRAAREQATAGATVTGVELAYLFENVRSAVYFPFEGLAGVAWGEDGTLVICDEARGKVYGLDPRLRQWTEFDTPGVRPYRPLAVRVDGFKVLVLDAGSRSLFRFGLGGVYQDRIVDFRQVDPAFETAPFAFDVDVDGRVVVTDIGEQQVLLLDSFLVLRSRIGGPGPHREQFDQPRGVCFQYDGGFVVSDQGNRRLQRFNRLGYWEATLGGPFEADNPFVAPQGLASDRWGNFFVADPAAGVVHVLDRWGRLALEIGPGLDLKATPLGPVDVAVGPQQQLAVTDRLRGAVLVFDILYE